MVKVSQSQARRWSEIALCCILVACINGCASYGIVHNKPMDDSDTAVPYSVKTWSSSKHAEDFVFVLAFSGGGTRASAMAYGVLQELRDPPVVRDGQRERLLDKVTHISSVSGGSFTAAYYGLHGDKAKESLQAWTTKMSTPEHPITGKFIQISFEDTPEPQLKLFLNKIPTSFSLTNEQVDALIASARSMLRANPEFKQLLADLARI